MKKYMDIERVRFSSDLVEENIGSFEVGDSIVIQEKVDGANASFTMEDGILKAYSRKNELSISNSLRGFFDYVNSLPKDFEENYIYFGEWLVKHSVPYYGESYYKHYIFDVWDKDNFIYLPQDKVKELCNKHGLLYINTLYVGEFISWDHCMSFLDNKNLIYGDVIEGIVIKNQSKICASSQPFTLKIINENYMEIKKHNHVKKIEDPQRIKEMEECQKIVDIIVTKQRVIKEINKMIDEGILPEKITPQDMKVVALNLPKRIYDDCIKEESAYVYEAGHFFSKLCSSTSMKLAKEILLS